MKKTKNVSKKPANGHFTLSDTNSMQDLIDQITLRASELHQPQITIYISGGAFTGQIVQQTPDTIVLQQDFDRRIQDEKGRTQKVYTVITLSIRSIIAIAYDMATKI